MASYTEEVDAGERFQFGKNWASFLATVDDERISEASRSLCSMLELDSLEGLTFVDVGCGSGLFSLAAMRLGADRVHSFDFDPGSVGCAEELRDRFAIRSNRWSIELASALDGAYVRSLGTFDVVYSWGVLHHTGDMWLGLANVADLVAPSGSLFIAIYNDQGRRSRIWTQVKRIYNLLPARLRGAYVVLVMGPREVAHLLLMLVTLQARRYVRGWTDYKRQRGMSRMHDYVDWVGGYPFEVAKPEEIFDFYRARKFRLERLQTRAGGLGCNQFLFRSLLVSDS